MEKIQVEQELENRRLEQTLAIVEEQLAAARLRSEDNKAEILAAKQEMREDTSHSISGLWSMDNFHALVELSQYANPVSAKVSEYERDANKILILEKMLDSPYFARLDFTFADEESPEQIYIGRSSLQDDKTHDITIYDWRSPIASVFYRFGTGEAFYESPGGRISGMVSLKRQYEIHKGKLEYFFDADRQIMDEFLRKLLSQNTSPTMKTIVETIQQDQDRVIRDLEMELLMVQGAAGSGKTSVALHRVAYLMYQGLATKLSNNDIVIISPHTLFAKYIAHVLPELGESNVHSLVVDEILRKVLQRETIQTRNQFLEALLSPGRSQDGPQKRMLLKNSLAFKASSQFAEILKRFIADLPQRWDRFSDIYYDGKCLASRQLLKAQLLKDQKRTPAPLSYSLQHLEKSILKSVHKQRTHRLEKLKTFVHQRTGQEFGVEERARRLSLLESTALLKQIEKFTQFDCAELYQKLFSDKPYFYRLAKGLELPDCIEEIIDFTCANLNRDVLAYDDALALTFLHLKTKGYNGYQGIKQVVIDEAQDYDPLHFEIFQALFPQSRYTILGDIKQTIGKQEELSLYDRARQIFNKQHSALVTLDKSFRCTKEILEYSTRFLEPSFKLNSFSRKGDPPAVLTAPDQESLDQLIIKEINACREKGYPSIGLICKTEQDAGSLYERLKEQVPLQLIRNDVEMELKGVFAIPVYLSKGLEFDAVLICDADQEHYDSEDDKNLLYIACTRALHRLNLFYTGDISPLL